MCSKFWSKSQITPPKLNFISHKCDFRRSLEHHSTISVFWKSISSLPAMSIPYLPPEIIMNILDYVHLDDLLLNARLVHRMWNVEALARANDFLTDWPDAVPYFSPVEVECLFPGNRLKKPKFDGNDPQCIFSGQVMRDGTQVKRFWVWPRSGHEPIATGFGNYSIQF